MLEEVAKISPSDVSVKIYLTLVNQHLGDTFTAAADLEAAREVYLKSVSIAESGMESGHVSLYVLFIQTNQRLASNAVARGQRRDALTFARRALRAGETHPPGSGPARGLPRGLAAMGLTYAALLRSPVREVGDRGDALSWLGKSLEAWRKAQSEPGFGEPHRREMAEVEAALNRVQSQGTEPSGQIRPIP